MPWDKTHKQQSKKRILDSAAYLFTHRGFKDVSINEVMQHAGMTRGAFYNHFKSKAELYSQAVSTAARAASQQLITQQGLELERLVEGYLQQKKEHQNLCPLAFLINDITQSEVDINHSYTNAFKGFLRILKQFGMTNEKGLQTAVLLIGGVAIANSLDDEDLRQALLQACQKSILSTQ